MDCLAETGLTPLSSILVAVIALALIGAGLLVMRRQRRSGIAAIAVLALLLGGGLALGPAHTATAASADCSAATPVPAPTATPTTVASPAATTAPTATPAPTDTPVATPSCVPGAPIDPVNSRITIVGDTDQVDAQFYLSDDDVDGLFRGTYDTWAKFSGAPAEALVAALGITQTVADGAEVALTPTDVRAIPLLDLIPSDLVVTETALYQGTLARSLDGVLTIDLRHHYTVWTDDPDRDFVLGSLDEWANAAITWQIPGSGLACDGTPLLGTVHTDGMRD